MGVPGWGPSLDRLWAESREPTLAYHAALDTGVVVTVLEEPGL